MINKKIFGLLGLSSKAGKIVFGTDACIKAIKRKKVSLIIVANDSSERTKNNFNIICRQYDIPLYNFGTIEELSNAIGKINKAVIGVINKNFSRELKKLLNGGEVNG